METAILQASGATVTALVDARFSFDDEPTVNSKDELTVALRRLAQQRAAGEYTRAKVLPEEIPSGRSQTPKGDCLRQPPGRLIQTGERKSVLLSERSVAWWPQPKFKAKLQPLGVIGTGM